MGLVRIWASPPHKVYEVAGVPAVNALNLSTTVARQPWDQRVFGKFEKFVKSSSFPMDDTY